MDIKSQYTELSYKDHKAFIRKEIYESFLLQCNTYTNAELEGLKKHYEYILFEKFESDRYLSVYAADSDMAWYNACITTLEQRKDD